MYIYSSVPIRSGLLVADVPALLYNYDLCRLTSKARQGLHNYKAQLAGACMSARPAFDTSRLRAKNGDKLHGRQITKRMRYNCVYFDRVAFDG